MPHQKIKTVAVKLESLITFRIIFSLFIRGGSEKKVDYEKLKKEAMKKKVSNRGSILTEWEEKSLNFIYFNISFIDLKTIKNSLSRKNDRKFIKIEKYFTCRPLRKKGRKIKENNENRRNALLNLLSHLHQHDCHCRISSTSS